MRFLSVIAVFVMSVAICGQAGDVQSQQGMPELVRFSPDRADKSLDPCDDFFQYSCSKWIKANPIPADQAAWGSFGVLGMWNVAAIRETLESAASASSGDAAEKKVGDYYASCMDEAAINKAGITPLKPVLEQVDKLKDKAQMPQLMASIHQMIRPANLNFLDAQYPGVLFGIYYSPDFSDASRTLAAIDQSGMGMPGREFYLKDDAKSKEIRDEYVKYVAHVLELSGTSRAQASSDAQTILAMETEMAKAAMDIVLRRDPKNLNNKMSLEQVQALTPSFSWKEYLSAMDVPDSPQYLVFAPDFFRGMQKLILAEPIEHWRAYLRYSIVRSLANSLSQPFVEANFDFFARTLAGTKEIEPRWRRCSYYADADLGEAVGQAYVKKFFSPQSKVRMLEMVKAIENALQEDIDAQTWMAPKTKALAHEKLRAQVDKIAYPDHWRDYSALEITRDDFSAMYSARPGSRYSGVWL